jgi:N-acetylmuramoyl-L-alanine amidase CwlA
MGILNTIQTLWANRRNYGSKRKLTKYIVLHYTANDGDRAVNNAKYFANAYRGASAHWFVDDNSIYNAVPEDYISYSVGGARWNNYRQTGGASLYGVATNSNTLNIEMCDTVKDGVHNVTPQTVENARQLTMYLMAKYGIDANHVIRHFDVTGKSCPAYWATANNEGWNSFKASLTNGNTQPIAINQIYRVRKSWGDVKSQIGAYKNLEGAKNACKDGYHVYDVNGNEVYPNSSVAPTPVPTPAPAPTPVPAPAPQPAKEQIAVDGSWGKATTILAQKVFGCSCVDGIVSRQPLVNKKYLEGAYEGSWQFTDNYNGGSSLIKAIQNWLGIKADGYMGKGSVMALQSRLGVRADGYMGKNTVKAFQKWLNNR